MIFRLSTAQAKTMLDAWLNATGVSLDSFILEIRSGTIPANADTAPTGTVLVSITLPADAFSAASSNTCAKLGTWSDPSADATGTGAWWRLRASGDLGTTNTTDRRCDGDVTATGGGGALEVQNTSFAAGQVVTVTNWTFTQPLT